MTPLTRVRRATARRSRTTEEWRAAIRDAYQAGESLRAIAREAGITHVRVLQILRD